MTKKKDQPRFTVENCNFHGVPHNPETIAAVVAIARAAEANAKALERAADAIKGPDALLKLGCP